MCSEIVTFAEHYVVCLGVNGRLWRILSALYNNKVRVLM